MKLRCLLLWSLLAPALFAIPVSISTGTAPWTVNGNPAVIEAPIATPFWITLPPAAWVGTTDSDGSLTSTAAAGTYIFTLDLGSYLLSNNVDPQNALFLFQFAADNNVVWTMTGGSLGGVTSCLTNDCFSSGGGAPRAISGISTAANSVLTATVTNTATGPTGLLVVGIAENWPEPSTYTLLGLGGIALSVVRFRARRR